jgi:sugar phosphate isomerase/epimerase
MYLGIFAKTFTRPTLDSRLDAVQASGIDVVQFNLAVANLPTLPDAIDEAVLQRIQSGMTVRGLSMAAISGTFNMIHPDRAYRQENLRRLRLLARVCQRLGAPLITLCTGTRDPADMWRWHPDNDAPAAWDDLLETMREALQIAAEFNVKLGVEPETGNVVNSARRARALLDAMQSPYLKIVMDGSNLLRPGEVSRQRSILDEAFDLLGKDITLAHAKDVTDDGLRIGHCAAGKGQLDWAYYVQKLRQAGYAGALVMHGLEEHEVAGSKAFLESIVNGR